MRELFAALAIVVCAQAPNSAVCVIGEPTRELVDEYVQQATLVFAGRLVESSLISVPFSVSAAEERRNLSRLGSLWLPPSVVTAPVLRFVVDRWWKGGREPETVIAVGTWSAPVETGRKAGGTMHGGPTNEYLRPAVDEPYLVFAGPSRAPRSGNVDLLYPVGHYCLSKPVDHAREYIALLGPGEPPL